MPNILDQVQTVNGVNEIKDALRDIGCDVDCSDGLNDIANIIRNECVTGPNAVVNATLEPGPGIRILPIGKTGYKISATSGAQLESDLTDYLPKGTSVHKTLHYILYKAIPCAIKEAASAPSIVKIDLIKIPYDGIDYYENPAFNKNGEGRKSGLTPNAWYIRLFTYQMKEPFYLNMGPMIADIKTMILSETVRLIDHKVQHAIERHLEIDHHKDILDPDHDHCHHHHHDHCHCPGEIDPGFTYPDHDHCHHHHHEIDPGFTYPDHDHCHHHHHEIDPGFTYPDHDHCHCHPPFKPSPCQTPTDEDGDGICDVCGWSMSCHTSKPEPPTKPCNNPIDEDGDGICDVCGFRVEKHTEPGPGPSTNPDDQDGDGICDVCGLPVANHNEDLEIEKILNGK